MALVRSGAVELGPSGIRVNAVAPGVVWTPRVSGYLGEEGRARNGEQRPAAPGGAAGGHRRRHPVPRVRPRRLRDRPDAGGRRRRRRQVPVPAWPTCEHAAVTQRRSSPSRSCAGVPGARRDGHAVPAGRPARPGAPAERHVGHGRSRRRCGSSWWATRMRSRSPTARRPTSSATAATGAGTTFAVARGGALVDEAARRRSVTARSCSVWARGPVSAPTTSRRLPARGHEARRARRSTGSAAPSSRRRRSARWLAYGDSIAEGWVASRAGGAWPAVAGRTPRPRRRATSATRAPPAARSRRRRAAGRARCRRHLDHARHQLLDAHARSRPDRSGRRPRAFLDVVAPGPPRHADRAWPARCCAPTPRPPPTGSAPRWPTCARAMEDVGRAADRRGRRAADAGAGGRRRCRPSTWPTASTPATRATRCSPPSFGDARASRVGGTMTIPSDPRRRSTSAAGWRSSPGPGAASARATAEVLGGGGRRGGLRRPRPPTRCRRDRQGDRRQRRRGIASRRST